MTICNHDARRDVPRLGKPSSRAHNKLFLINISLLSLQRNQPFFLCVNENTIKNPVLSGTVSRCASLSCSYFCSFYTFSRACRLAASWARNYFWRRYANVGLEFLMHVLLQSQPEVLKEGLWTETKHVLVHPFWKFVCDIYQYKLYSKNIVT